MSTEQNKTLTLGSLFDGSGGFPLGGLLTGQITPVWSSEIEPFAIRVTTKRLPQVKHYGDVSAIAVRICRRWTSSLLEVPVRICLSPVSGTVWMVHGPACFMKQSES